MLGCLLVTTWSNVLRPVLGLLVDQTSQLTVRQFLPATQYQRYGEAACRAFYSQLFLPIRPPLHFSGAGSHWCSTKDEVSAVETINGHGVQTTRLPMTAVLVFDKEDKRTRALNPSVSSIINVTRD